MEEQENPNNETSEVTFMNEEEQGEASGDGAFCNIVAARIDKFYIAGEITGADRYLSWFETIRNATENDQVHLHINSQGGNIFTALQFMRALRETNATVIASVEGACFSAATLLFLSADYWEISKHSSFLFHNYTNAHMGKGHEMHDAIVHEKAFVSEILYDVYAGFLTNDEISGIIQGKDMWMNTTEMTSRINLAKPATSLDNIRVRII